MGYHKVRGTDDVTLCLKILIGGRSKFLVNGHTAQQQVVQTLFQSVQLNINNPHFLIMQGRITKVLNMKPPEILSMIEEAAGTRMFEERKEKALKTIAKKEKKVAEITQLLSEEIVPKLDKLRGEKRAYLEFQKTQTEIERLSRIVTSYDYSRFEVSASFHFLVFSMYAAPIFFYLATDNYLVVSTYSNDIRNRRASWTQNYLLQNKGRNKFSVCSRLLPTFRRTWKRSRLVD